MKCYSQRSKSLGGQFIVRGKINLCLPDAWLHSIALAEDSELLYLHYSTCTVKIIGYRLGKLYTDAVEGKIGTVIAASAEDAKAIKEAEQAYHPYVTEINVFAMEPVGVSELITKSDKSDLAREEVHT